MASRSLRRTDLRTRSGRAAATLRSRVGEELRRARVDAGLSIRVVADAATVDPSHVSLIERGRREPSLAALTAICDVLGLDVSVRLYPRSGPMIRDRMQAAISEALLKEVDPRWKRSIEVSVWRPVRGVIDAVLAIPSEVVVATEIHSELRRIEQQVRWAEQKALALPSAESWSILCGGDPVTRISTLLVLRNTRTNRDVARAFEATLRVAYPAKTADAIRALHDAAVAWPGSAVIWADVSGSLARVLPGPPRGVTLGR